MVATYSVYVSCEPLQNIKMKVEKVFVIEGRDSKDCSRELRRRRKNLRAEPAAKKGSRSRGH
jgi:hypothetical protein